MNDPALILFDLDGTIFDSQDMIVKGFEEAFHAQGYAPPTRAEILYTVGLSLDRAVATMRPDFDGVAVEAMAGAYVHAVLGKHDHKPPFYPGMEALVHELNQYPHLWLGVATGKNRRGVDPLLEANGLAHILTIKQTADLYPSKPAPDMITEAMSRYGVGVDRTVMIGDTVFDIQMGKNAGAKTIGVDWGYHGDDVRQAEPDVFVSSAQMIITTLKNWNFL